MAHSEPRTAERVPIPAASAPPSDDRKCRAGGDTAHLRSGGRGRSQGLAITDDMGRPRSDRQSWQDEQVPTHEAGRCLRRKDDK
jgi:hypothetical protein